MAYLDIINQHIAEYNQIAEQESEKALYKAASPLRAPNAPITGRNKDIANLREGLFNPEKANVAILGEPGTGKTAVMQGFAYAEDGQNYLTLSVDIERLVSDARANKDSQMANGMMDLVQDVSQYSKDHNIMVVLFIDEFHRIAQTSPGALEALKPILEQSVNYGIRIVAATTFEEYNEWIAPNRPLDQRLLRLNLPELGPEQVTHVLENRAKEHGVDHLLAPRILSTIAHTTKQYLPSNSQPRASIDILNMMIGKLVKTERMVNGQIQKVFYTAEELNQSTDKLLNRQLLNNVMMTTQNIDIDNEVEIKNVSRLIKERVLNQKQAVDTVIGQLEMALEGFVDPTRPKFSFLSTGSTGVGKTELAKAITEALNIPMIRFDMSRYSRSDDAQKFADALADYAWEHPNGYILIDEAEKSSKEAMNILLQVLDDARLTSSKNSSRVISFAGCIINLTTNTASHIYQNANNFADKDEDGTVTVDPQVVYQALSKQEEFETAVLGRIDEIVPFVPLPAKTIYQIANRYLKELLSNKETTNRPIFISPDVMPHVIIDLTSNDSEAGGARDAKRITKNKILVPLSHFLVENDDIECPIVVHLDQMPAFREQSIGDRQLGDFVVTQCHPMSAIDSVLTAIGQQLNKTLINDGMFIPITWTSQDIVNAIAPLLNKGVTRFKTTYDIDQVVMLAGNQDVDIHQNMSKVI